jgi:hypothetical protein
LDWLLTVVFASGVLAGVSFALGPPVLSFAPGPAVLSFALGLAARAGCLPAVRLGAGPVPPPVEFSPGFPFTDVTGP